MRSNRSRDEHPALVLLSTFPTAIDIDVSERTGYANKLSALKLYRSGAAQKEIFAETGIVRQHVYYLMERIQKLHSDGEILGHRALLPHRHAQHLFAGTQPDREEKMNEGERTPKTGALSRLYSAHSSIHNRMLALVLRGEISGQRTVNASLLTFNSIHHLFKDWCRAENIVDGEYPFQGQQEGAPALKKWVAKVRQGQAQILRMAAARRWLEDDWYAPTDQVSGVYRDVECDGTSINLNWILEVPALRPGSIMHIKASRLWLVVLIETRSSAILGYCVSIATNYGSDSVLKAIRSALVPWKPRKLTLKQQYAEGDRFPTAERVLQYVCWDNFKVDSWAANWSDMTLSTIESTVNCVVKVGPVDKPNVRPYVESFNGVFKQALDMVRKEGPCDPADESKIRAKNVFAWEKILDAVDLLLARYNNGIAPNTSETRIDVLLRNMRGNSFARRIPEGLRGALLKYDTFDTADVTEDKGRLQVWWKDARYFDDVALNHPRVHPGVRLRLKATSEDVRRIAVSLDDGFRLGELLVEKRFQSVAHTTTTRAAAVKSNGKHAFSQAAMDIVLGLHQEGERTPRTEEKAKHNIAKLALERASKVESAKADEHASSPVPADKANNVVSLPRTQSATTLARLDRASKLGPSY
jgi:putative transposase